MKNEPQVKIDDTEISLSEWFDQIKHSNSTEFREEDTRKVERLNILNKIIGLPIDEPTRFAAEDVVNRSQKFKEFLITHGEELCALRLAPKNPDVPKLRWRGMTVNDVVEQWLPEQKIDLTLYNADFFSHVEEVEWSVIFIVNKHGVFGEFMRGGLKQLSVGHSQFGVPVAFSFNYSEWFFNDRSEPVGEAYINKMINHVKVENELLQADLDEMVDAKFYDNYLFGYFEVVKDTRGTIFVDYNRILGEYYNDWLPSLNKNKNQLTGLAVSKGKVSGVVNNIINPNRNDFNDGEILVCNMTTPDYLYLMRKASAIITEQGGLLSHAAIVSRELGVPCIVGVKNATKLLKDGDKVEVDADSGVVRVLEN